MNKLRDIINAGGFSVATRVNSSWPLITELVGKAGFDYVEFLAEYAPVTQHDFENIARAAELWNIGCMIKVDFANRTYVAQKAIASGFNAVLFTDHKDAKTVEQTVNSILADSKEDDGKFGFSARRFSRFTGTGDQMTFQQTCRDVVKAFMIEKTEAVKNIDEICSVPGVDMIQFGPSDYSLSSGVNRRDYSKEIREAEEKCIKAAVAHGVRPRCEVMDVEDAKRYLDLGVRDFNISGELWILQQRWSADLNRMKSIIDGEDSSQQKSQDIY